MSLSLTPVSETTTRRDEVIDQFVADATGSLNELDAYLARGNVVSAREMALALRIHLDMFTKALDRHPQ